MTLNAAQKEVSHKLHGGALVVVGYLLSPLSWWNDIFLNLPLAYLFGSLFGWFSRTLFLPMFVLGYWLTNVAGLLLMHHGVRKFKLKNSSPYGRAGLIKDLLLSIFYTLLVVVLVKLGWLKFPSEYF